MPGCSAGVTFFTPHGATIAHHQVLGRSTAAGVVAGAERPGSCGIAAPRAAAATAAALLAIRLCSRRGQPGRKVTQLRVARVFIDGEAGTTGLQVRERLEKHPKIEILSLEPALRKDESARQEALKTADAAVLCLPDEAAIAAVALAGDANTVIVDASTAHRVSEGWEYGFPEMAPGHAAAIASSKRIANPGCYSTGFIGLVKPLVDAGILPVDVSLSVHAISGYSGGGKDLISTFEDSSDHEPWGAYGFGLSHKHLAEMKKLTGLQDEPIFCPSVGNFRQGMVVSVPLRFSQLATGATAASVHEAYMQHYKGKRFLSVAPLNPTAVLERGAFLRPDTLNNTNRLEIFCFANEQKGTLWLAARLDNLGKGASGACVQNLNLALGFDEDAGLD